MPRINNIVQIFFQALIKEAVSKKQWIKEINLIIKELPELSLQETVLTKSTLE